LPPDEEIPGAEVVQSDTKSEEITRWRIPSTRLTVTKVQEGPSQGAYLFTPETVRRANGFYSAAKQLPYRTEGRKVSQGFHNLYVSITKRQPTISADTSSPRGTLTLFLDSVDEIYEAIRKDKHLDRNDPKYLPATLRIIGCLDQSELPEFSREFNAAEAALCLKEILDRVALPPTEQIPGAESIQSTEGKEALVSWQIPQTQLTIARVQEGPHRGEYLFSPESVRRATEFYEKAKRKPYRTEGRKVSEGILDWYFSVPGHPTV
jgi:MscS family membrane protein